MRQWGGAEDEGNSILGVLTVGAEAGGDPAHACPVQQTDGRIAQQGHDGWSLPDGDQAPERRRRPNSPR